MAERGRESAMCSQALCGAGMTTALAGKRRLRLKKLGLRTGLKKPSSTQGSANCARAKKLSSTLRSTREPVVGRTFSCLQCLQKLSSTQRSAREKKLSSTQRSTREPACGRTFSCLQRLRCQPAKRLRKTKTEMKQ